MASISGVDPRVARLLRKFDEGVSVARAALVRVSDPDTADAVVPEARAEFERLIREIPYASREKDPFAASIIRPAQFLAYTIVLKRRGHTKQQTGTFIAASREPVAARLGRIPDTLVRIAMRLALPVLLWRFKREASASQQRDDPDEFVYEIVDEPGTAIAMNVKRCAVCTLFDRHDSMEVVPYICATDDQLSDALGLGLRRTSTCALGGSHCDFRCQPGGTPRRLRDHYDLPLVSD